MGKSSIRSDLEAAEEGEEEQGTRVVILHRYSILEAEAIVEEVEAATDPRHSLEILQVTLMDLLKKK